MRASVAVGSFRRHAGAVKLRVREASASMRRDRLDNLHVLLAAVLAPNSNCIDVGASVGDVLAEIIRVSPLGHHLAFEPIPFHARSLAERFPRVKVHELALADHAGRENFVHVCSRSAFSGLRERKYPGRQRLEQIEADVARLDDVVPADNVPALIKIDVEGGELGVLRGGLSTMLRHRPLVVFEHGIGAAPYYGTRPEEVWQLLTGELGLRIFDSDGNGPYDDAAFTESFFAGKRWNYFARQ
jgi:FkbM family methyltransferase